MQYTREQINALLRKLPEDLKEAIASVDDLDIILGIEKKYRLHFDQTGELSNEILLLTVGLTPPQEFIKNIQRRLNIPEETAREIGLEVNEKIFRPVRDSLKKIHRVDEEKEKAKEKTEELEESPKEIPKTGQEPVQTIEPPKTPPIIPGIPSKPKPIDIKSITQEKLEKTVIIPPKTGNDPYREPIT